MKSMTKIRPLQEKDAESIAENVNNIHVWNNLRDRIPYPYTIENARDFISFVNKKESTQDFAIEFDGEAAGCIGFIPGTDVERLNAEIGFWIGEKYWGKGIATDAVIQLRKYIFENTDIIRLFAVVFENNTASGRVLEKAGFEKIAVLKKAAIKNNTVIDLHYFELLKENI